MKRTRLVVVVVLAAALLAGLFQMGFAARKDGRVLTKVTFIHYRRGHAKPPWAGGGGGKPGGKEEGYYTYLSKGARWRVIEDFLVNPSNSEGLSNAFVADACGLAMDEWEAYGGTIFGQLYVDAGASFNDGALDGENTLSFGTWPDPNVIAVANVWGYFQGPPRSREIIEADVLFNEDFEWGDADGDPTLMDLLNIAVHEVGHAAGMGDLYETMANLETMYGYSTEGETIKPATSRG
ncbi:MAG: matrixin family metalloprotease [Planctomycetota bacterium]|jgi:hypothetical protein